MFAEDTATSLRLTVALINSAGDDTRPDTLATASDLVTFLDDSGFTGRRDGDAAELSSVRELRGRLSRLWRADLAALIDGVNDILATADAVPQLVRHGAWGWHVHATHSDSPVADRAAVEFAMALIDVIRTRETARLRECEGPDCDAAFFDFSKNRSRLYCATGNCGNRVHVAAYRARKSGENSTPVVQQTSRRHSDLGITIEP